MRKLQELNKQDNGYSLAGVLVIFIVATVLGMSIVALSVNSMNISNKEHDDQSAFYIAESGTNFSVSQVQTLVEGATVKMKDYLQLYPDFGLNPITGNVNEVMLSDKFFEFLNLKLNDPLFLFNEYDNFEEIKGIDPIAELSHSTSSVAGDNPRQYVITSKGIIGDENRTVHLPIEIEWFAEPKYALLAKDNVTITGSGVNHDNSVKGIKGDIGTVEGSVKFDGGAGKHFDGDLFVEDSENANFVTGGSTVIPTITSPDDLITIDESTSVPNLPPFPDYPTDIIIPSDFLVDSYLVINNGHLDATRYQGNNFEFNLNYDNPLNKPIQLDSFQVGEGNTVYVNTGTMDKVLVVTDLLINGDIKLIDNGPNTGDLSLIVKNKLEFTGGSGSINLDGDISRVNVYYAGNGDLSFVASHKIYASLYSKSNVAEITFAGGGGFYGNILTNSPNITLSGGSQGVSQLVLAPNATVAIGTGDFVGTIVSNDIHVSGGTVKYEKINSSGPLSLEEIMNHPVNDDNSFMNRMDPKLHKESLREK